MLPITETLEERVAQRHKWFLRYRSGVANCLGPPETATRDLRIDAMKGLAIILVVLGHAEQVYGHHLLYSLPRLIIYSFHMPLFFFLSGCVAFASAQKSPPGKLLSKRFKNLIIPFLSWYFVVGAALTLMFRDTGFREYAWRLVVNPFAGRWFLLVLFWCFVLLVFANWLARRLGAFAYLLVLFVPTIITFVLGVKTSTEFLGLSQVARGLIFFFTGYLLFEYKDVITSALRRHTSFRRFATTTILLAFPLLIIIGSLVGRSRGSIFSFYTGSPAAPFDLGHIQAIAVAFLGIAWVVCAFELKRTPRGIRWLAWLGNYTLDIFVIHMAASFFILRVLVAPLATTSGFGQLFAVFLMTLCAILFSLFVSIFILRRKNILAFIFLGRPYEKPSRTLQEVEPLNKVA